ncbi:hypothetical protein GCM10023085_45140 [Actinomadura viridis]|uniref:DUF397 domain-containing protein n=1 Tax=Actinomadura viridis TaxID=58110 RepID=A0A931DLQ0_9ACTN|nr:DUF397 domain-containing protein [Actinomadura viridis]MBG6089876.1 hypothetical protein [Actinomadura viridis]
MSVPDMAQAVWRRSRRSTGGGNNCVEVASVAGAVGVRDSKAPTIGAVIMSAGAWRDLAAGVKTGRYDLR